MCKGTKSREMKLVKYTDQRPDRTGGTGRVRMSWGALARLYWEYTFSQNRETDRSTHYAGKEGSELLCWGCLLSTEGVDSGWFFALSLSSWIGWFQGEEWDEQSGKKVEWKTWLYGTEVPLEQQQQDQQYHTNRVTETSSYPHTGILANTDWHRSSCLSGEFALCSSTTAMEYPGCPCRRSLLMLLLQPP